MAKKKKYYNDKKSGMLNESSSSIANLPQDVKYHAWPEVDSARSFDLNDSISGINNQMKDDSKAGKRGKYPQKY